MSKPWCSRYSTIRRVTRRNPDALVISSAGIMSRVLYHVADSHNNFYMEGSMGCALGFGIGLALNINRKVIVFVGDGEILMSLGTLTLMNKLRLPNLYLYIFDNNQYQSTGGQHTSSDGFFDYDKYENGRSDSWFGEDNYITLCRVDDEDRNYPRIPLSHKEISRRFYNEINGL